MKLRLNVTPSIAIHVNRHSRQCERLRIFLLGALAVAFGFLTAETSAFAASKEKVLYSFCSVSGCTDGLYSQAGLIFDAAGNLYGTTYAGGAYGYGTIFQLMRRANGTWIETVLHSFNNNGTDGHTPDASLIFDAVGNLYGTTAGGGVYGAGTVFELAPEVNNTWNETVLHSFNDNGTDGDYPDASLIFDSIGNLYGVTLTGGAYGYGIVFELTPAANGRWTETVLHSFNYNHKDGYTPYASLIVDAVGNLYGVTGYGGAYNYGIVFELTPGTNGNWKEKVLHNFNDNGKDGFYPTAGLISDGAGNMYSATEYGGAYGFGTVFRLAPGTNGKWTEKVLHSFNTNGEDGRNPLASLIFDAVGNLYGTTEYGGAYGFGTAFRLAPQTNSKWTEKVLHSFNNNGTDGYQPFVSLTFDAAGNLYGTTKWGGGYTYGTVFKITP